MLKEKFEMLEQIALTESALKKEIKNIVLEYIENNRQFKDGEKIAIYNNKDVRVADGFVAGCACSLYTDLYSIKKYVADNAKMEADLKDLRYEVFEAKKDGTISKRHFHSTACFKAVKDTHWGTFYIKPLD